MKSRFIPRALGAAILLGGVLGSTLPALAQDTRSGPVAARLQPGARPELVLRDGQTLEVRGRPLERLLLLYGEFEPGSEACGRRVRARHVLELALDADGAATVGGHAVRARTIVQAWQSSTGAAGPWGAFSAPVSLLPAGTPLESLAQPGDLVVTEFMKDPSAVSDSHGEWIELLCTKPWRLDIEGVTLSDLSGASFTLDNGGNGILLYPGQRFVLGNDDDPLTNGGVPVDWKWSGFSLKNSADEILLTATNGNYLDVVVYDDGQRWPDTPGMSISLTDPISDSFQNDDPGLWCSASSALGAGPDTGTPGAPNDVCP